MSHFNRRSVRGLPMPTGGCQLIMPSDLLGGEPVIVDGQLIKPPDEPADLVRDFLILRGVGVNISALGAEGPALA
jgi:hypothetical protein